MALVGLNFTKISAERKGASENVRVESNVAITNVIEAKMPDPKKTILKFQFLFTSKFEPNIGLIELNGELIEMYDKDLGGKILEGWNKSKSLHKDVAPRILNAILAKSNIEAIIMSKELGLPSPIQMPKVEVKPKAASSVDKSESKSESKIEKDKKK